MGLDPGEVVGAFAPCRPPGMTRGLAIDNLRTKAQDPEFRDDLDLLVASWPSGYDVAAELVISQPHARL